MAEESALTFEELSQKYIELAQKYYDLAVLHADMMKQLNELRVWMDRRVRLQKWLT